MGGVKGAVAGCKNPVVDVIGQQYDAAGGFDPKFVISGKDSFLYTQPVTFANATLADVNDSPPSARSPGRDTIAPKGSVPAPRLWRLRLLRGSPAITGVVWWLRRAIGEGSELKKRDVRRVAKDVGQDAQAGCIVTAKEAHQAPFHLTVKSRVHLEDCLPEGREREENLFSVVGLAVAHGQSRIDEAPRSLRNGSLRNAELAGNRDAVHGAFPPDRVKNAEHDEWRFLQDRGDLPTAAVGDHPTPRLGAIRLHPVGHFSHGGEHFANEQWRFPFGRFP